MSGELLKNLVVMYSSVLGTTLAVLQRVKISSIHKQIVFGGSK